jgi:hypothetical protein
VECCGLQWTGQYQETPSSLSTPLTISRYGLASKMGTVTSAVLMHVVDFQGGCMVFRLLEAVCCFELIVLVWVDLGLQI